MICRLHFQCSEFLPEKLKPKVNWETISVSFYRFVKTKSRHFVEARQVSIKYYALSAYRQHEVLHVGNGRWLGHGGVS